MEFSTWITIVLVGWVFCSTAIMATLLWPATSSPNDRTDKEQSDESRGGRPPRD
jgi:hypothetical protein